jgi:hypothetical protein
VSILRRMPENAVLLIAIDIRLLLSMEVIS